MADRMLVVVGGLPGTGKTTVGRLIARGLGGGWIRVDTIEQGLREHAALPGPVQAEGYEIGYRVAAEQLRAGLPAVAECVNPLPESRNAWSRVAAEADVAIWQLELVCSDETEHRRRIESRGTDVAGLRLPTWQDVLDRDYQPWDGSQLRLDTATHTAEEVAADVLTRLAARRSA